MCRILRALPVFDRDLCFRQDIRGFAVEQFIAQFAMKLSHERFSGLQVSTQAPETIRPFSRQLYLVRQCHLL